MLLAALLFFSSAISVSKTDAWVINSVKPPLISPATTINETKSFRQARIKFLTNRGWVIPSPDSEYAYARTTLRYGWHTAGGICRGDWSSDIAVTIKDDAVRWKVGRAMLVGPAAQGMWVGLKKSVRTGRWKWTDGTLARSNDIVWAPFQPDGRYHNCGEMWGEDQQFTMNNEGCNQARYGLCEVKILT